MNKYQITFKTWDKIAALYQAKFMDLDLYNDTYDLFCDLLSFDSSLLELGCGPGNVTKYVLSKHPDLNVLATDISPNMLALAKNNNPTANFKILDTRKINELNMHFDSVLCGFCLPYLSWSDAEKLIQDSFQILNDNGVLYLSVIEGDYSKSGFETGSTGDKCYVYYHSSETLIQCLKNSGFEVVHVIRKDYPKGDMMDSHLILIARKG